MSPALHNRASSLEKARLFFKERNLLEVDPPILMKTPQIDTHIEVMEVFPFENKMGYLHTSPEYAMKKIIAGEKIDIFYLGHVFRKGEEGRYHSPEFTMAEWYRMGFSLEEMMEETRAFLSLFLDDAPLVVISYRDAFLRYVGIDPFEVTKEELLSLAKAPPDWDKETLLDLLLTRDIEPHLGHGTFTAITDYPKEMAALAKTHRQEGIEVARRFEIYSEGIELTNGYEELNDSTLLRSRFEIENKLREMRGKKPYPLDEEFLDAIDHLPPCCGVSVGFDRALSLGTLIPDKTGMESRISSLPFPPE